MFKLLKASWAGEVPLYKVFWQVYVLYGLIVIFGSDLILDYFITGKLTPLYIHSENQDKVITLSFPYFFFSSMCVFACTRGTTWWLRVLVRFIVIFVLFAASFHLTHIGIL